MCAVCVLCVPDSTTTYGTVYKRKEKSVRPRVNCVLAVWVFCASLSIMLFPPPFQLAVVTTIYVRTIFSKARLAFYQRSTRYLSWKAPFFQELFFKLQIQLWADRDGGTVMRGIFAFHVQATGHVILVPCYNQEGIGPTWNEVTLFSGFQAAGRAQVAPAPSCWTRHYILPVSAPVKN